MKTLIKIYSLYGRTLPPHPFLHQFSILTSVICLIGKPDIWDALPDALLLHPTPPGPPKHPRWVYTTLLPPKYKISHPQLPPNSKHTTRSPFLALFMPIYYCPQPPPNSLPYYTSPPSHPAPLASQAPYPPNQKTLLLILTHPGTMAKFHFFGWWGFAHMHL